jgi:hypothetical protein
VKPTPVPFRSPVPSIHEAYRQRQRSLTIPLLGGRDRRVDGRIGVLACYPYAFDPAYRDMLRKTEGQAAVTFVFPEDDPSPRHLDDKLLKLLSNVGYAIFDRTGWNANVAFEFGMAMGVVNTGKPFPERLSPGSRRSNLAIFVKHGTESMVPSDLGGMGYNPYADLADLEAQLVRTLSRRFPLPPRGEE